ncbi:MAG: acetyl-CoA carboxylase biotin carboxyl carrier protein [Melioribacteraceae bacterium]
MDINEIKKLIKIVESSEINSFSMQEGNLKIKISKNGKVVNAIAPAQVVQPQVIATEVPQQVETKEEAKDDNSHIILSPIVGTFYRAPAPDADSYVKVGDSISSGSVLCIVEAMKLMNEIESDVEGKIIEILVEDGSPVEFNQPLFKIEK